MIDGLLPESGAFHFSLGIIITQIWGIECARTRSTEPLKSETLTFNTTAGFLTKCKFASNYTFDVILQITDNIACVL